MRKKIAGIIIGIGLLLLPVQAHASAQGRFVRKTESSGQGLAVYCANLEERPQEELQAAFQVSVSGEDAAVERIDRFGDASLPLTVYCLVDVSGSIGAEQNSQMKEVLTGVANGLRSGDNMLIGTLGNDTTKSGYLEDSEQIRQYIDGISSGHEDTNLYKGIVDSLKELETDSQVKTAKCLLILSDGEDDQLSGITEAEAHSAVGNSTVPVYTVAVLKSRADTSGKQEELAKLLGSFARESAGGKHYVPLYEQLSGEAVGQDILASVMDDLVVHVQMPVLPAGGDKVSVRVNYTASDAKRYEDEITVFRSDLPEAARQETEVPETETSETEPAETETASSETGSENGGGGNSGGEIGEKDNRLVIAAAAALAAVLLIAAVVLVRHRKTEEDRKRNAEKKDDTGKPAPGDVKIPAEEVQKNDSSAPQPERTPADGQQEGGAPAGLPEPEKKTEELKLYAIGYAHIEKTIRLEWNRPTTIGRTSRADIVLNPDDKRLSSVHCRVIWDGEKLLIEDAGSTNGTFVNGINLKEIGRAAVHRGDTIRMGGYEYRLG